MAFLALGLAALAVTGWQALDGAASALRQASYDRLTAVRETRASELQRYITHIRSQVEALSTDESTLTALERFQQSWGGSDAKIRAIQTAFVTGNPHPPGSRDLLLTAPGLGSYGETHARFHPTFHGYKLAFGFYDFFLISADGRVLYTVMKEPDLGVSLESEPYRSTPLAAVFRKARETGTTAMQDYAPYVASGMAPAAFVAAPLRRAGRIEGVLAIQIAIDEVNDVMDGGRRWREQGLGETGQVYVVGPDNTLRSDLRRGIEDPSGYLDELAKAGIAPETIKRIRKTGTAVLAYPLNLEVIERIREGQSGTDLGRDTRGTEVLRSHAPMALDGFNWVIIAEMENAEALIPVVALRQRIVGAGVLAALAFFFVAGWLGASVTGPVLAVASVARRLGRGERGLRMPVNGDDEIAQLSADFNRMSDDLERTTVSKRELEALAGRLITAQEEERTRVARELHDDFTQRLAAAAFEAGRLEKLPDDPEPVRAGLGRLKNELAEISEEVHTLSRRLHPRMLDDLGLVAALEGECRAVFERGGPVVELSAAGPLTNLSKDAQLAFYRIAQEALRNIHRHSGAEEAEIRLARLGTRVEMEIRDNGRGFDRSRDDWHPGLGLASMEERARLLGGGFRVESKPGEGTRILVWLPCGT